MQRNLAVDDSRRDSTRCREIVLRLRAPSDLYAEISANVDEMPETAKRQSRSASR